MHGIQRVRVWSTPLRLLHWLLALCVPALLASGWLAGAQLAEPGPWRDLHLTAGYLTGIGLALRVALLFVGRLPTDRWPDLLPVRGSQWRGMRAVAGFYVRLGRAPLPGYFGHNPLWGPLYVLLFAALAVALASGLALAGHDRATLAALAAEPWWLGWTRPEWHAGSARFVAVVSAAHVLAVFAHDARGTTAEISAMVGGSKYFEPLREALPPDAPIVVTPIRRIDPDQR